jgi:trigger factor
MSNLPDDVLQNYSKSLLEKEETIQNLYEKATEEKVIEWLKKNIKLVEKTVSSKEFNKLMSEHSHEHEEHEDQNDHEDNEVNEDFKGQVES